MMWYCMSWNSYTVPTDYFCNEPLPLDSQDGYDTMELLSDDVLSLVKFLDINNEFDGIHDYIIGG